MASGFSPRTPGSRQAPQRDVDARLAELVGTANRLFDEKVTNHSFVRDMRLGILPLRAIKEFLISYYNFIRDFTPLVAGLLYRFHPFLKRHPEIERTLAGLVVEEIKPGAGGHMKMFDDLLGHSGLTPKQAIEWDLIPEARAYVDFTVRIAREAPWVELWSWFLIEEPYGRDLMPAFFGALNEHYGFRPEQLEYFRVHHEADTQDHEESMAHGEMNKLFLRTALEEGYVEERPGWGMERSTRLGCDMFSLLFSGHYKRTVTC
jgi:pyrroloquinoline quinone (PQQ) biosynthesis protein C